MNVYIAERLRYSSFAFLRKAYQLEYGEEINIDEIYCNSNGKPFFISPVKPFFNLSHSGEYVVCAFSKEEIGVDIQRIKRIPDAVVSRYLHTDSLDNYARVLEWTKMESYAKMKGTGLPVEDDYSQEVFQCINELEDYIITVCSKEKQDDVLKIVMI